MEGKKRYLAPVSSKSVVQIIIDRLTGAIIEGELKPGDKIPTEPELAEELQVGRNSVREAIRILVAYGVLEIRRPEGTFVCNGFSTQIINPMIYQVILQKEGSYDDLIGLRKIIENGIMTLLMESYKAISKSCDKLLKELKREPEDVEKILEADIEFHKKVAEATENSLVMVVHDVIIQLTRASRKKTIEKVIEKGDKEYLEFTHKNLLEKLNGDNVNALYQAINDSYFYWKDIYK